MDLNNKYNYTASKKIDKIPYIIQFITESIDKNQKIKRYMRYLTKNPLSVIQAMDYKGEMQSQPDLRLSLLEDGEEGIACLFPDDFNPYMTNIESPFIFIHNDRDMFNDVSGAIKLVIDIMCPEQYNKLTSPYDRRIYKIAGLIANFLDGYTLDYDSSEKNTREKREMDKLISMVGNITFKINGEGGQWRLSKAQNIVVFSFPVLIENSNMRSKR